MSKKKIEPTDRMIRDVETWGEIVGVDDLDLLRYILNHPDAAGLFTDEDDRPWEPLGESDQVRVGDEVKWDYYGLTMTATVARVDKTGSLYTAAGLHIGVRSVGTWHVRRAAQELPTKPGSVIVPADGCDYIESTLWGETFYARAALRSWTGWYAAWRAGGRKCGLASSGEITPGTWKVADQ